MNQNDIQKVLEALQELNIDLPQATLEEVERKLRKEETSEYVPNLGWFARRLVDVLGIPQRHWLSWGLFVNTLVNAAISYPSILIIGTLKPDADLLAAKEIVWLVFSSIGWYLGPNFYLSIVSGRSIGWKRVTGMTFVATLASFLGLVLPLGFAYGLTRRVLLALISYSVIYGSTVVVANAIIFPLLVRDRGVVNTLLAIPNAAAYLIFFGLFSYLGW